MTRANQSELHTKAPQPIEPDASEFTCTEVTAVTLKNMEAFQNFKKYSHNRRSAFAMLSTWTANTYWEKYADAISTNRWRRNMQACWMTVANDRAATQSCEACQIFNTFTLSPGESEFPPNRINHHSQECNHFCRTLNLVECYWDTKLAEYIPLPAPAPNVLWVHGLEAQLRNKNSWCIPPFKSVHQIVSANVIKSLVRYVGQIVEFGLLCSSGCKVNDNLIDGWRLCGRHSLCRPL